MYAGSPPGLAQVHSPYKQAVHQSPPEVGSPMPQSMPPYASIPQQFSPHGAGPTNMMSPNHQGMFYHDSLLLNTSQKIAVSPLLFGMKMLYISHITGRGYAWFMQKYWMITLMTMF